MRLSRPRAALVVIALACAVASLAAQQTVRLRTVGSAQAMLTINDLTWDGEYRLPNSGSGPGVSGNPKSSQPSLAVLYVGDTSGGLCADTRRFIIPNANPGYLRPATIAATNPAQVTTIDPNSFTGTYAHDLATDMYIRVETKYEAPGLQITGWPTTAGGNPIGGAYKVTVTSASTFTIPLDLTGGSVSGVYIYISAYPGDWGDFVEYCRGAATSYYTGASPESSSALVETGRWDGVEATSVMGVMGDTASGNEIGGMYWDQGNSCLWLNIYGYYYGANMPNLMCVALTHTAHATRSGYFQVGTRYGPWYYRDATETVWAGNSVPVTGSNIVYWKAMNHGFMQVPASAQSDLGGRTNIMCGAVGATGGLGNWGIGFRAINLPSLALTPLTQWGASDSSGVGLRLADYTGEFGASPIPDARRDGNYTQPSFGPEHLLPAAGLEAPDSGSNPTLPGYWQASMDQSNGCVWVETATKHGIISFGREVIDGASYGYSPLSETFRGIDAITHSGTTVTVTMPSHNMGTGTNVRISCVTPTGYNGTFAITKIDADHFSYTSSGSLGTSGSYSDYATAISSIGTGSGTVTVTTSAAHNLATGMRVAFSQVNSTPDLTGTWYTATVTGSTTFTIPETVTVAGTATGYVVAATHDNGLKCWTFGFMMGVGWDSNVYPDQVDPGRGAHHYTNGYNGDNYRGIIRGMDPTHIRGVALGTYNATSTDTNWSDLGDWHTKWPNMPEMRVKAGASEADESRLNLLSVNVNGLVWDGTAKQIIWVPPATASNTFTAASVPPPTLQFISVP